MFRKGVQTKFSLQFFTGLIIALHGLSKILFILQFTGFVVNNLYSFIPSETFLILLGSFIPFLEFFTGLLILFNVKLRQSIVLAVFVLAFLALVVISSKLYIHLLFEVFVFFMLVILSYKKNVYALHNFSKG